MECDINNDYNGWAVMIEQGYILINGEWVLEDEQKIKNYAVYGK